MKASAHVYNLDIMMQTFLKYFFVKAAKFRCQETILKLSVNNIIVKKSKIITMTK